jgi:hypothetical protein
VRYATEAAVRQAVFSGEVLSVSLSGVHLRIDPVLEEHFIEVSPDFDREILKVMGEYAERLGYEVMPEWECRPQAMGNGATRHWMAEKEVADDSRSALKAV